MSASTEPLPGDHLLSRCAEAWGLRDLVFVRKMENIVYAGTCDAGKVYLRLTTPLRRMRLEIEAEIHWMEHLTEAGIRLPLLVPDKQGNKIASFTEGTQHFEAVVFSAVTGEHPPTEIATDPKFLHTLGALIAKMHQATQCYAGLHPHKRREEWFEERGLRHALEAAAVSRQHALRRRLNKAVAWLQRLERTPHTYGLIHADLGALNLFIDDDGSLGIIDFDDSCYHWFVFDLAIVMFSTASRCGYALGEVKWLPDLVEGYRTIRPLSQQEVDLIPRLIDFACLRLYFWIEYHELHNTFHDDVTDWVAKIKQRIKSKYEGRRRKLADAR